MLRKARVPRRCSQPPRARCITRTAPQTILGREGTCLSTLTGTRCNAHLRNTLAEGVAAGAAPLVPGNAAWRRVHVKAVHRHARQHGLLLPKEQKRQVLIGHLCQQCMMPQFWQSQASGVTPVSCVMKSHDTQGTLQGQSSYAHRPELQVIWCERLSRGQHNNMNEPQGFMAHGGFINAVSCYGKPPHQAP